MNTAIDSPPLAATYDQVPAAIRSISKRLAGTEACPTIMVTLPDGTSHTIGDKDHVVEIIAHTEKAVRALMSFDELRIAEAYLHGEIDIEGSMYELIRLRYLLTDNRPWIQLKAWAYRRILDIPMFRRKWIGFHYDEDPRLFFAFLDEKHRCYSHGYFESEHDPLELAMERKLGFAVEATRLEAGMRVLDIGGGWGSFTRFAGSRGIKVTSVTISEGQRQYLQNLISSEHLPCEVLLQDVYDFRVADDQRFDAIVNLGVTEHLSNYRRLISQYRRLLKPGGRVYFDSCSTREMYDVGSYINKYIFPGCTSYLCLDRYLTELAKTDFELELVVNDRRNYMLTTIKWAENLERNREDVVAAVGEQTYRRFRMLIWACAAGFSRDEISAYHVVLQG